MINMKIILIIGGVFAFFLACTGISMTLDTSADILSSNEITKDVTEPIIPTLNQWSSRLQVVGWTALIAFITLLVPIPGEIKGLALIIEIFGGIIAWLIV